MICSSNSDFRTMAPAPFSANFLFLPTLLVSPELLMMIGFLRESPAKVVFKSVIMNLFLVVTTSNLIISFSENLASYPY